MIKFTSELNCIYVKSDKGSGIVAMATTNEIAKEIATILDTYYNGISETDKMINDIEEKLNNEK